MLEIVILLILPVPVEIQNLSIRRGLGGEIRVVPAGPGPRARIGAAGLGFQIRVYASVPDRSCRQLRDFRRVR
jgi:hypothetical protein